MRHPIPDIRPRLRALREPRSPLDATLVVADDGKFVVLTLVPLPAARLIGQGQRALWETRVYIFDSKTSVGLASHPRYAVLSASRGEALARHETLVARLEGGTFETEMSREILAAIRPTLDRAAEAFRAGDAEGTVASLEGVIRIVGRLDAIHHFLHLYQELFLMRALALERMDPDAAKAAYRDFIDLYAGLPTPHPETLRGVARAREAVERLTPTPQAGHPRTRSLLEQRAARRS